ncbi:hypothetical protein [Vreelandella populi]|uniref:hypothetical protein n=1 Tax=Vreelandella populi TaxID=2498858 RepID=UPI0021B06328|nr:hypothetical protein [Halomonas populi]
MAIGPTGFNGILTRDGDLKLASSEHCHLFVDRGFQRGTDTIKALGRCRLAG